MLPEGWAAQPMSKLLERVIDYRGKAPPKTEDGVRLLTARNVRMGHVSLNHAEYIDADLYEGWMNRGLPQSGDIMFTTEAPLANVAMFPNQGTFALGQRIVTLRPNETCVSGFLFQFLLSDHGQGLVHSKASGSTALGIKSRELVKLPIPLPPLPEQRKIADILSTWDQAIEKTEALLSNARTQKRALMQQLLTGKRRFPAFEGQPWKEMSLGDVASISMGSSPKSAAYNDDGIGLPLIQGNADVKNGRSVPRTFTSEITTRCQPGDILLSVRAPVGSVAISDHEACVGRGAAVIRPKGQHDWLWLKHLMLWLEPRWSRVSQGSTFEAVNSKDLKTFVVPVPATTEEAKHIGSAIEAAHLDCDAMSGQITKLRTEKKALMQQLLTGMRRVVA